MMGSTNPINFDNERWVVVKGWIETKESKSCEMRSDSVNLPLRLRLAWNVSKIARS